MKLYAGIDLHSNNHVVVLSDAEGKEVYRKRHPNDLKVTLNALEPHQAQIEGVAVESTYNWYWLVDGLMDNGYRVHLVNTAAVQQYQGLKYADDNTDARWLSNLLRLGILPEGYIFPREERAVRDLSRKRMQLVQMRTANILSIQNIAARNRGSSLSANRVKALAPEDIEQLFPLSEVALAVDSNRVIVQALEEQIIRLEKAMLAHAKIRPELHHLLSAPGIGKVLALAILLETGDIGRFAGPGNYASYCRCVGSDRISNGKSKGKGNTKNGNKYLAWAYIEAANFAIRHNDRIKRYYQRKLAKTHRVVAKKTVAHKMARACYHMMRERTDFDLDRAFG